MMMNVRRMTIYIAIVRKNFKMEIKCQVLIYYYNSLKIIFKNFYLKKNKNVKCAIIDSIINAQDSKVEKKMQI